MRNSTISKINDFISNKQIMEIKKVEYLQNSQYKNLDIQQTLEFYFKRYVRQLFDFYKPNNDTTIADIGAGFGWLAIAFALTTQVRILAIEPDISRLNAAKKIARILKIENKIDWLISNLGTLAIKDERIDIVYCIEVIEHTYRNNNAMLDLRRITKNLLVLTTPNLWFPIIAHDTSLPFCHWLPIPIRKLYAKLFKRENRQNDNLFWSPIKLSKALQDFQRVSTFAHYSSFKKYLDTFPFYNPYGSFKFEHKLPRSKLFYYHLLPKTKTIGHYFTPNLASVFKRIR